MKDDLLIGRDGFHRYSQRLYQGPHNHSGYKSNMGELTLSHLSDQQVPVYVQDHGADPGPVSPALCRRQERFFVVNPDTC